MVTKCLIRREAKLGHVRVFPIRLQMMRSETDFEVKMFPIGNVFPSQINGKVYRPVSRTDPAIKDLASSIRAHGLREPLVITKDGDIISGHRRHAAAKLAGLTEIPCRVVNISKDDPNFLSLLVEFNKHRVKSLDEILRETVVNINPAQAHRKLIEHRIRQSKLGEDSFALRSIELREEKVRCAISPAKKPLLEAIQKVIQDHATRWPLSDRQIHYLLVSGDPSLIHAAKPHSRYSNTTKSYKALVELLTRARLEGSIPWQAISDPTQPVMIWQVHRSPQSFLADELQNFLTGYWRDLQQSQLNHIEVVGEKNTIQGIIRPVAERYTIPYTIGRGYCSLEPRMKLVNRFRRSGKENLVLLLLSDFDPDGEEIAHSFARSLRDDFGVESTKIRAIKACLTGDQVDELGLQPIMTAKETSSNYNRFTDEHGHDVYELEAVRPFELQRILDDVIDSVMDLETFNQEKDTEESDAAFLEGKKTAVFELLRQMGIAEARQST